MLSLLDTFVFGFSWPVTFTRRLRDLPPRSGTWWPPFALGGPFRGLEPVLHLPGWSSQAEHHHVQENWRYPFVTGLRHAVVMRALPQHVRLQQCFLSGLSPLDPPCSAVVGAPRTGTWAVFTMRKADVFGARPRVLRYSWCWIWGDQSRTPKGHPGKVLLL